LGPEPPKAADRHMLKILRMPSPQKIWFRHAIINCFKPSGLALDSRAAIPSWYALRL